MRAYSIVLESEDALKTIDVKAVQDQEQALKIARKRYPFEQWRVIQLIEKV